MVPQTRFMSFSSYTKPSHFCNLQVACSKRSDSGERCEVMKAMNSRGGLGREVRFPLYLSSSLAFIFFVLLFTSHRSPLSERLEQDNLQVIIKFIDCERSQIFFNVSRLADHGGENKGTFNRFCNNTLNENSTYLKVSFLKRKSFPKY